MKKIIFAIAISSLFGCTKTKNYYTTIYKTDTVFIVDTVYKNQIILTNSTTNGSVLKHCDSYPIELNFDSNKIYDAPNIIGNQTLNLSFNDSLVGCNISVVAYINGGGSINLSYNKFNTVVSLTDGSFNNPNPGLNLIQFIYLGKFGDFNIVSASVKLQP